MQGLSAAEADAEILNGLGIWSVAYKSVVDLDLLPLAQVTRRPPIFSRSHHRAIVAVSSSSPLSRHLLPALLCSPFCSSSPFDSNRRSPFQFTGSLRSSSFLQTLYAGGPFLSPSSQSLVSLILLRQLLCSLQNYRRFSVREA